MKFGDLLANEREFVLRSLAFCGMRIVVNLSTIQGRFKLAENELADQDVQEIHLLDESYEGIRMKLEELGFKKKGMIGKWAIYIEPEQILNAKDFPGSFRCGHLIILNKTIGTSIKAGTKALIYRMTEDNLCSLITEDGSMIGSFDEADQMKNFIFLKDTFKYYTFKDTEKLLSDFSRGVFKPLFK